MHPLAERVLAHIRRQELLRAGDRVGVAVSGGIDSVALLRLLLELRSELGVVLSVVHFNHKLRGAESDADQEFVANLARAHELEFHCESADVARQASEKHISVEAAARELRYGFFRSLIEEGRLGHGKIKFPTLSLQTAQGQRWKPPLLATPARSGAPHDEPHALRAGSSLTKIATGHTLDDQAETVLLRLIRGTGLRGLGGIHPRILVYDVGERVSGEIIRPLLSVRRCELNQYLIEMNQPWREDSTNVDAKFTRNRVRKIVVPLLEKEFNPAVAENLAELAEIARGEEEYWENEVFQWFGTTVQWSEPDWARPGSKSPTGQMEPRSLAAQGTPARDDNRAAALRSKPHAGPALNASLNRAWFLTRQVAVQRRVVRAIGEYARVPLEFRHIEEILHFAAEDSPSGKELSLPFGWKVRREPESLVFHAPNPNHPGHAKTNYEYALSVPGRVTVPEVGSVFEALRIHQESEASGYNPEHLLDAESVRGPLIVRNWRPGDRFWPAHTKSPKKIKELLQERHVAQPERRLWPVVAQGDEIVWVRGFPAPARLRAKAGREAVLIRETALTEDSTAWKR